MTQSELLPGGQRNRKEMICRSWDVALVFASSRCGPGMPFQVIGRLLLGRFVSPSIQLGSPAGRTTSPSVLWGDQKVQKDESSRFMDVAWQPVLDEPKRTRSMEKGCDREGFRCVFVCAPDKFS